MFLKKKTLEKNNIFKHKRAFIRFTLIFFKNVFRKLSKNAELL